MRHSVQPQTDTGMTQGWRHLQPRPVVTLLVLVAVFFTMVPPTSPTTPETGDRNRQFLPLMANGPGAPNDVAHAATALAQRILSASSDEEAMSAVSEAFAWSGIPTVAETGIIKVTVAATMPFHLPEIQLHALAADVRLRAAGTWWLTLGDLGSTLVWHYVDDASNGFYANHREEKVTLDVKLNLVDGTWKDNGSSWSVTGSDISTSPACGGSRSEGTISGGGSFAAANPDDGIGIGFRLNKSGRAELHAWWDAHQSCGTCGPVWSGEEMGRRECWCGLVPRPYIPGRTFVRRWAAHRYDMR